MSAKISFPSALVLTALSLCAARGQVPSTTPALPPAAPLPGIPSPVWEGGVAPGAAAEGAPPAAPASTPPGHLSSWITYDRPKNCCGPTGANGPIGFEIYLRSGVSIVGGNTIMANTLQNGYAIDGGGRSLFFNPAMTAAWTVSYGVSTYTYHGTHPNIKIPLKVLVPAATLGPTGAALPPSTVNFGTDVPGVTMQSLNETFLNLGGGRDWWLLGSANSCDCPLWRVGVDVGGRYGSANVRVWELRHRTDVIGGVWIGVHSDIEIPCGCGWFVAGFRAEWGYIWSDILQRQNDSDITTVNLLGSIGYRF